ISQLHVSGTGNDDGLYFTSVAANSSNITTGAASADGINWTAKSTSATNLAGSAGTFNFYADTGLTAGNTYAPTKVAAISGFSGGGWIDMPTTGPSGIGSGGPGNTLWVGYASAGGNYLSGSAVGDVIFRNNQNKRILMGIDNGSGTATP